LEAPGGQEPGTHRYALSLIPFSGAVRSAVAEVDIVQAGLRAEATPLHPGRMPSALSFLAVDPPDLNLTAVKSAEDGQDVIVRLVNLSSDATPAVLRTLLPIRQAALVLRVETLVRDLTLVDRKTVRIEAGPHQVVTLRLEFDTT